MKKFSLLVLIAALVSFAAVSCKKYEDGPTFSLASKKGRAAGDWKVEKATYVDEDGTTSDETAMFQAYFTKFSLTKDGDFTLEAYGDTYTGTWDFDDKKENIVLSFEGEVWTWEIKRLKQKELWVKMTFDPSDVDYFDLQLEQ